MFVLEVVSVSTVVFFVWFVKMKRNVAFLGWIKVKKVKSWYEAFVLIRKMKNCSDLGSAVFQTFATTELMTDVKTALLL